MFNNPGTRKGFSTLAPLPMPTPAPEELDPNSNSSDFMAGVQQSPQDFCLLCLQTPLSVPNFISRTSAQLVINFLDLHHDPDIVSLLAASSYCSSCFSTLEIVIELLSTLLTLKESLITKILTNLESPIPNTSSRLQNLLTSPRERKKPQNQWYENAQAVEDEEEGTRVYGGIKIKSERELMDDSDDYDTEGELVINESEENPANYVATEYSNGNPHHPRFPCHECLAVFPDLSQLLCHVDSVHGGDQNGSIDINKFQRSLSKPPFSLSQLIVQAISSAPAKELTLQGIYTFIQDHYAYYRCGDRKKAWQNSIRHTLSLNPNFLKGAEHGSCWRLNPETEEILILDSFEEKSLLTSSSGRRKVPLDPNQPNRVHPALAKTPKKLRPCPNEVHQDLSINKTQSEATHSSQVLFQSSPPKRKSNIPKRILKQSPVLPAHTLPTLIPGYGNLNDSGANSELSLPTLPPEIPLPLLTAPLDNPAILEGLSFSTFLKVIKTNSILNQLEKQQQQQVAGVFSGQTEPGVAVPKTRTPASKKVTPNGQKRGRGRPPGSSSKTFKSKNPVLPTTPGIPEKKSQPHRKRLKYDRNGQPLPPTLLPSQARTLPSDFGHASPKDLPNYMDSMQHFIASALGRNPVPQSGTSTSTGGPTESSSPSAQMDENEDDEQEHDEETEKEHEEAENEYGEQLIDFSKIKVERGTS